MPYSETFLQEQENKLRVRKAQLEKELAALGHVDAQHRVPKSQYEVTYEDVGTDVGDVDENIHELEDYQNKLSTAAVLEDELRKVDEALRQIAGGTYGQRSDGSEISEDRLRAVPEATE